MFGKGYLFYTVVITIFFAISTKAKRIGPIIRPRMTIKIENVVTTPFYYGITLLSYEYDDMDLTVNRVGKYQSSLLVKIAINRALIRFLRGASASSDHRKYDLNNGGKFELKTEGVAAFSNSQHRVYNCEFTFGRNQNTTIDTQVSNVVMDGIFKELRNVISRDLCRLIRT